MEPITKESTNLDSRKAKESSTGLMVVNTWGRLITTKLMDRGGMNGPMVESMKDTGMIAESMARENSPGQMGESIRGNTITKKCMVMGR